MPQAPLIAILAVDDEPGPRHDRDLEGRYPPSQADRLFEVEPHLWAEEAYLDKPVAREALPEAVARLMFGRTAR